MTSIRSKAGNGIFILTVGGVGLKLISLATIFLMLNKLSLYEYGVLELGIAAAGFFSIFQLPGFYETISSDVLIEKSRKELHRAKALFNGFLIIQCLLSIVAVILMFLLSGILSTHFNSPITDIVKVLAITLLLLPLRTFITLLSTITFNYKMQVNYSVAEEAGKFVCLLLLFWIAPFSVVLVPIATLLSQLLILPVFILVYKKLYIRFFEKTEKVSIRSSVLSVLVTLKKHGKWSIFITYLSNFGQNIRIWIIKLLLGTDVVAIYAVAHGLIGHVSSLLPINRVMMPIVSEYIDDRVQSARIFMKTVKYQVLAYVAIGVGSFIFLPVLFSVLFPQYTESLTLFSYMLITLIPLGFGGTLTSFFIAIRKQETVFYISLIRLSVILITLPVSIYLLGIYGIVVEMFITATWFAINRYLKLQSWIPDFKVKFRDFFTVDDLDRFILKKIFKRMLFQKS